MSKPVIAGLGAKALKTAGMMLVSIVGLSLFAFVALYFLAEPLVERYIKKQIGRQTNELYQIEINELQLHLSTRSITLHGVHFYTDTTVLRLLKENGKASQHLFDVQVPSLKIEHINLIDLIFNNQLSINTVVVAHPIIEQLQDGYVKDAQNRENRGGSMEFVRIRELDIQNASYRLLIPGQQRRLQHEIARLSLQAQDLQLDLQAHQDISGMMRADVVDLEVQNYTYHSPDSVYAIRVGQFIYSSRQHALKAVNVEVQPDIKVNVRLPKSRTHHFVYQLKIPELKMHGLDVAVAWQTKQMHLNRLLLDRAALSVTEDLTIPDAASLPKLAGLYAALSPYLKEIGVKKLLLTNSRFSYRQKNSSVHTVHSLAKATIYLQALQLDSTTLFKPKEKAFAAAVTIKTEDYTYSPSASPYTLKVGNMKLSTRAKTLQVDALHLTGDWDKNDNLKSLNKAKRTFYDIKLPMLRFHELDLLEAFRTTRLTAGSITAAQPMMDVRTDKQVPGRRERPDLKEMYKSISGLIARLEVGKISITDAALTQHSKAGKVQLLQQLDHTSLTATGLVVDSAFMYHPNRMPLQNLILTARNYRYWMPENAYTLALTGLRYAARQKEFSASSVKMIPRSRENGRQQLIGNDSRTRFALSANTLRVTGLDLVKALHTGHLQADQVLLQQPDVSILLDRKVAASKSGLQGAKEGLFGFLDVISAKTIRLEKGSFTFSEKLEPVMRTHLLEHATITVAGFSLTAAGIANLADALPMEEMTLLAEAYSYWSTDSLYTIRLDSVYYNSRREEVIAHRFLVSADREVNERLKAETPNLASRNLVDISAERSHITGFNLIHAYATGQYHMRKLLLTGPHVTILQDHNVTLAAVKTPAKQGAATASGVAIQKLTDMATTFRVERIEVADGTFDFHILEDTIRISQTLDHVALGIDHLRLISLQATDPLEIFEVEDINVLVKGYTFFTRDSLYALEVKEMRASMHNRTLSIDSLRLRPLYSKEQYAILFRYARDRIDLTVPAIEVQEISLRALFNHQDIVAHKMLIQNPDVEIYRDNSIGIDPEIRPPTLQSALREAGFYIRLDTILVEKNNLKHPVIAINGKKPAVFLLDNIRMQAFNVTNDTALIRHNNMLTVNASALFMGVSTLQADFQFQMDHPEDRYTYEGTLESMDLTALNPLLENMIFIRIKSGQIHDASFKIDATREGATGWVHFPYNNLKVQLLNKQDPNNPGLLLKASSRLINTFIIKSNNPSAWGKFREGDVNVERDPKRTVSYHMSQSMRDGVTSSLMTKLVRRIVSKFVAL